MKSTMNRRSFAKGMAAMGGSILLSGCGGNSATTLLSPLAIAAADVFINKAETWEFKNGYGDLTWIDVMPQADGSTIWHYTKNADRAYWTPGAANAELWFHLAADANGEWYATDFHVLFPLGSPWDHTPNQDFVNIVTTTPGMARPYLILGNSGTTVETTFNEFGLTNVRWHTSMYVENGMLVSEQWENCVHEKWWFKPGAGLWKVAPLDIGNCKADLDPMLTMERVH